MQLLDHLGASFHKSRTGTNSLSVTRRKAGGYVATARTGPWMPAEAGMTASTASRCSGNDTASEWQEVPRDVQKGLSASRRGAKAGGRTVREHPEGHERLLDARLVAIALVVSLLGIGLAGCGAPVSPPTAPSVAPAAPTPGPPPASPNSAPLSTQGTGGAKARTVVGYYVPYDATSWASLEAHASDLDFVNAQWVTVDPCGGIGSRDDRTLITFAAARGVKVLPSLLTSSGWLNHRLLTDPAITGRYLNEIVSYVVEVGYPGFDLDMEGIDAGDRDAYSDFVARLADALHRRGKLLTLAIPAKSSDVRTGWAGPYDYAALGEHADRVLLMAYDYSWSSGPPGSIAPQDWVDKVAAYATSQMPREKVLIGLAFYGYDWNRTTGGRARALLYPQAVSLAKQHGVPIVTDEATRSATFSYTAQPGEAPPPPPPVPPVRHEIAVRAPSPCAVQPPPTTPTPAPAPTPIPASVQQHVVWLEDAASAAARLEIAARRDVGGVAAWRLGQEDPGVWRNLAAYRSGQ